MATNIQELKTTLHERGMRMTPQRQLVLDALLELGHATPEQVCQHVQRTTPSVNITTVYRTLELLVEEGLVRRTDLGSSRSFYEPAHEHPHHHVVCERCGAVAHVHDDALGTLAESVESASGYALGEREITLFGLCRDCRRR